MKNAKKTVSQILKKLPENSTLEDIQYRIYVNEKIEKGLSDVKKGRLLKHQAVEKRMRHWLSK